MFSLVEAPRGPKTGLNAIAITSLQRPVEAVAVGLNIVLMGVSTFDIGATKLISALRWEGHTRMHAMHVHVCTDMYADAYTTLHLPSLSYPCT